MCQRHIRCAFASSSPETEGLFHGLGCRARRGHPGTVRRTPGSRPGSMERALGVQSRVSWLFVKSLVLSTIGTAAVPFSQPETSPAKTNDQQHPRHNSYNNTNSSKQKTTCPCHHMCSKSRAKSPHVLCNGATLERHSPDPITTDTQHYGSTDLYHTPYDFGFDGGANTTTAAATAADAIAAAAISTLTATATATTATTTTTTVAAAASTTTTTTTTATANSTTITTTINNTTINMNNTSIFLVQ